MVSGIANSIEFLISESGFHLGRLGWTTCPGRGNAGLDPLLSQQPHFDDLR